MSIINNLITIFPEGQDIIPDIFEKIWHELNIVNYEEIFNVIKELEKRKRTDLMSLISLSQKNIVIDRREVD